MKQRDNLKRTAPGSPLKLYKLAAGLREGTGVLCKSKVCSSGFLPAPSFQPELSFVMGIWLVQGSEIWAHGFCLLVCFCFCFF